ncbi:hypothetical protein C1752_01676 [Acaryochloris thomasi RCC1774]|uniref:Uncharacterized protein n=1 Tax=Acaryochloris thomasi RCC1774 TaxID=1764569 RepID=A0A2W1JWF8_9CYAN|nr:hypothetical protein [Acaryochloris thomasi]PZD74014.1 hypothetical protein C1752_01676 [Acaryochloris thomasi RCC1774]
MSPATLEAVKSHPPKILRSRKAYRTCHIYVPDSADRLAAISTGSHLYSFFRALTDREKAIAVVTKLFKKGESTVITCTPKAYVIWVLEPEASLKMTVRSA